VEKPKKSKQFAIFRCFTAEIRLKVWRLAFPPPLSITIVDSRDTGRLYKRQRENYSIVRTLHPIGYSEQDILPSYKGPITLRICRKSRIETLKIYMFLFKDNPVVSPFYFSPTRDVYNMQWDELQSSTDNTTDLLKQSFSRTDLRHIKCISIPRLEFEVTWKVEDLLLACPWVEELIITEAMWHKYGTGYQADFADAQDLIEEFSNRWAWYKQSPLLKNVLVHTVQVMCSHTKKIYGERKNISLSKPLSMAILEQVYREKQVYGAGISLLPMPRPV
jgi:hypothetical protein